MEIRIGALAKRSGCEVVTIRYYEKEGLMPKPARSGGNFRLYGDVHIERLQFIRHCRSLDMTLSEIRALLGLRDKTEDATVLIASIQLGRRMPRYKQAFPLEDGPSLHAGDSVLVQPRSCRVKLAGS